MNLDDLRINPELDLCFERIVPLTPEQVFRAWTTPALLEQWFCPKPWRAGDFDIDVRPGGQFKCTMYGPEGEVMPNAGCYLEVVPNRKLVWTDALHGDYRPAGSAFMTGVVLMEPDPEGTRYFAMARHATAEATQQHRDMGFEAGWGAALAQLIELMQKG